MGRNVRRALPAALGAAVLAACALLLAVNLLLASAGIPPMKLVPSLTGVTAPSPVRLSWAGLLDGSVQAAAAREVGGMMPLQPWAVRLRNQAEYSLFGSIPSPALLGGRHGAVIELQYADEYCGRDLAAWRPEAERWAARLRTMQDDVERRGHAFLYVLTPSKVAQYPDILPRGYSCPATQADRAGWLPAWLATLRAAGVHVADTAGAVMAAHADFPFPLFQPSGTHWNAVGSAVGQGAVLAGLDHVLPGRGLAPGRFTWTIEPHATGNDRDIARLMNQIVPAADTPAPAVTVQPAPPPEPCRPPRVVIVGGSFSHATLQALGTLPCPVPVVEYEYWSAYTLRWTGGSMSIARGDDPSERDAAVLAADVLVFEENEESLRRASNSRALYDFLQANRGG